MLLYQRQSYRRSRDRRSLSDMACSWDSHDRTGTGVTSVHQRLTCAAGLPPLPPPLPVGSVSRDPPHPPRCPGGELHCYVIPCGGAIRMASRTAWVFWSSFAPPWSLPRPARVSAALFHASSECPLTFLMCTLPYPRCLFSADRSLRAALMCDVFMVSIRFCLLFPSSRRMLIAESVHTVMLSPLFNVVIAFLHAPCIAHSSPLLLVATVAPIVSPSLFPCSIPQANVTMSVSSVAVAGMIAPPKPAISAAFWFLSLGPAPSVNAQKWVCRAWVCLRSFLASALPDMRFIFSLPSEKVASPLSIHSFANFHWSVSPRIFWSSAFTVLCSLLRTFA